MSKVQAALIGAVALLLAACASTPEQKAAKAAAQQKQEQELQVALAGQCDKETAMLMQRQFNPPEGKPKSSSRNSV